MTIPHPDQQRAERCSDETAAMNRFASGPARWLYLLFSRNPLIRVSDRVEALALALTVAVALVAAPIAGSIGTAVYDSGNRAEQSQNRTTAAARVIDRPARSDATRVHAQWFAAGTQHTGLVHAPAAPKPGATIEVSVNQDGSYAGPQQVPASHGAMLVAMAIWLAVTAAAVAGLAGVRTVLNRTRAAGWRLELAHAASGRA